MRNHLLRATAGNKPAGGTDDNIANVELLLQGEGGSDGQANNAFVDSSTKSHSMTAIGDVTQGSFSPFSPKGWSGYFDGSNDYLSWNASYLNGEFTWEFWVYPTHTDDRILISDSGNSNIQMFRLNMGSPGTITFYNGGYVFYQVNAGVQPFEWTHLALSRGSDNVTRLFVNGVQKATANNTYGWRPNKIGQFFYNGSVNGNAFKGYMSNMRIVHGTQLYSSNFTPPTEPLTAVTNTKLLTLQDNRIVDNSVDNNTITRTGDVFIKPTSPFSDDRTYQKASYFSGKFDGTNDYLSFGNNSDFAFGTGQFTVEAWVYSNGAQDSNASIMSCGSSGFHSGSWQFDSNHTMSPGKWFFIIQNSSSTAVESTNSVTHNQWTHLAVSRDSNNVVRLFVDGVLNDSATISTNLSDTGPFKIGTNRATGAYFDGYISNVRIVKGTCLYTSAFTPSTTPLTPIANTKLLALQDYYLVDRSSSGHSITNYGGVTLKPESPFSNTTYPVDKHVSWQFDGTNDYIDIPDVNFEKTSIASTSDLSGFSLAGDYSFVNSVLYFCRSANGINNSGSSFKWQTARRFDKDWSIQVRVGNGNPTHSYIETGFQIGFATSNSTTYHSNGLSLEPQSTRKYSIELTCYGTNSTYIKLYDGSSSTAISSSSNIVNTMPLVGEYDYWFDYDHSASTIKIYQANSGGTKPSTPAYTFNNVVFDDTELYTSIGAGHNGYYKADWTLKQWILDDGTGSDFAFGTEDFTVEGWFNATDLSSGAGLVYIGGNANSYAGVRLGISSNQLYLLMSTNGTSWQTQTGLIGDTILTGSWNHFAVTRNSTTVYVFLNGTQIASPALSGSLYFGTQNRCGYSSSEYLNGYLSNLRIVKGTALYTSDFTVPTEPLTAVSGTKLLTLQSGTLVDNSASGHAFTNNGAAVTEVSPFGAALIDRAGSMYFGGSWDYIRHSSYSNSDFAFGTGDFTVEGWVYPMDSNAGFFDTRTALSDCGYGFGIGDGSSSGPTIWDGCGYAFELQTSTLVPRHEWSHIAFTRKSNTVQVFVNGVSAGTAATGGRNNNVGGVIVATNSNTLYQTTPAPSGAGLKGYMADLRVIKGTAIYTSNFTPPTAPLQPITNTVLLLQGNNGAIEDSLGKLTLETKGNVQIDTTVKKFGSGAIEFDGNGDYLKRERGTFNLVHGGDFTVEAWINMDSSAPTGYGKLIAAEWEQTAGHEGWIFWVKDTGKLEFWWEPDATAGSFIVDSNSSISLNTWHHVAVSKEGVNFALFVDGQRVANGAHSGTATDTAEFTVGFYGSNNNAHSQNSWFDGHIDDLRITKGVARYDPTQTTYTVPSTSHPTK